MEPLTACTRPAAGPNVPSAFELEVASSSISGFISDWDINLKNGGTFIKTKAPLPVGTAVLMKMSVPDVAIPFELVGRVVRVDLADAGLESGMGVTFVDFDHDRRQRLASLVERLRHSPPRVVLE